MNADRLPAGEAGDFVRAALRHSGWPQGIWVVAPDGRVLAFHYFRQRSGENWRESQARWVRETLSAIETGLTAFGPVGPRAVAPADPLPYRGAGVRPDGSVRLAVASRFGHNGRFEGNPAIDSVELTAAEWAAFRPPALAAGTRWELPGPVARPFAKALSPMTDSIYTPRPDDAKVAELRGEVEAVSGTTVLVRYRGKWETAHDRDGGAKAPVRCAATAEGLAVYDTSAGQLRSLLLVFQGTYRGVPPWDSAKPTAAVVEWRSSAAHP